MFSVETEDEVFTTLKWSGGMSGQLSVSWSDDSQRKMTTRISVWGHQRQDLRRPSGAAGVPTRGGVGTRRLRPGLDGRVPTELTEEVDFYVRG